MKSGVELIKDERERQINSEGWTPEHDDAHDDEQLAYAAVCYAMPVSTREALNIISKDNKLNDPIWLWPWDKSWWKPTPKDRIRELVKAGALIAAEIDRLQRLEK